MVVIGKVNVLSINLAKSTRCSIVHRAFATFTPLASTEDIFPHIRTHTALIVILVGCVHICSGVRRASI